LLPSLGSGGMLCRTETQNLSRPSMVSMVAPSIDPTDSVPGAMAPLDLGSGELT